MSIIHITRKLTQISESLDLLNYIVTLLFIFFSRACIVFKTCFWHKFCCTILFHGIFVCQISFLTPVKIHSIPLSAALCVCYLTRKLILTLPQSPARVRRIIRDRGESRELFKKSITSGEEAAGRFRIRDETRVFLSWHTQTFRTTRKTWAYPHVAKKKRENDKVFFSSPHYFIRPLPYSTSLSYSILLPSSFSLASRLSELPSFYWQRAMNIKLPRWGTFSSLPGSANLPRDEVPFPPSTPDAREFVPIVSPHPLDGLLLNFRHSVGE